MCKGMRPPVNGATPLHLPLAGRFPVAPWDTPSPPLEMHPVAHGLKEEDDWMREFEGGAGGGGGRGGSGEDEGPASSGGVAGLELIGWSSDEMDEDFGAAQEGPAEMEDAAEASDGSVGAARRLGRARRAWALWRPRGGQRQRRLFRLFPPCMPDCKLGMLCLRWWTRTEHFCAPPALQGGGVSLHPALLERLRWLMMRSGGAPAVAQQVGALACCVAGQS